MADGWDDDRRLAAVQWRNALARMALTQQVPPLTILAAAVQATLKYGNATEQALAQRIDMLVRSAIVDEKQEAPRS